MAMNMAMVMAEMIARQSPPEAMWQRALARRSTREWGIRGALALLAAAIGYVSVINSLAEVIKRRDPFHAHRMAPENGQITALLAANRMLNDRAPRDQGETTRLSLLALRQDPTAIQAVATLGLQAQIANDIPAARRLFAYSQRLSRRHLQTQLWAIEDSVARGDVSGTLRHYDIALRTSKTAPVLLFPPLYNAIVDPAVRTALARTLAGRPGWGAQFMDYLVKNKGNSTATASLLVQLHHAGLALPSEAVATAVDGLLADQDFEAAWRFYASVRPGVSRLQSRDPRFSWDLATPSAFDWTPSNDAVINASIQREGDHGLFEFANPPSVGGPVLKQLQMLPAGEYRLEGHGTGIDQPDQSLPYWLLTCRDGRELGRVVLANLAQTGGRFSGRLNVPANCLVQTLALVAPASDGAAGNAGQIDWVRLFR